MLAVKKPSREAFNTAIDACNEAGMVHLEAMAKERYGALLKKENDTPLANDYLIASYWLYQDWGAHAKALQLSQEYEFLEVSESVTLCFNALYYIIYFLPISWFVRFSKHTTRKNAESTTLSTAMSGTSTKKSGNFIPTYSFNSTFNSRKIMFERR